MTLYALNNILVIFPFLVYLILLILEKVSEVKEKSLFFTFAIITSIYLITKYNYDMDIIKVVLFICLLKNMKNISLVIMAFVSIYSMDTITFFNYMFMIVLYFILLKDVKKEYKIITLSLLEILLGNFMSIIYMLVAFVLVQIFNELESVVEMHKVMKAVEYEKDIKENLFQMVHEVKNPIAVSKGYLDMLDVDNKEQVNKFIPIIKGEIEKSILIMNEFMSLNRLKVEKVSMDLRILLDEVTDEVELLVEKQGINFTYEIPDNEIKINGDFDKLKQVFVNIIKNSIEADSKNITLKVKNGSYVVIRVIDDGIGIKDIKRIGEAFYTTKKSGTGLGVKFSMEIIKLHNGIIEYRKLSKGTEAIIKIKKEK